MTVKPAAKTQQSSAKPQKPSRLRQRLILGTSFAASAFIGGYRGYVRRAYAACTGGGGTYTCSGTLTTTQTLSGTPLSITTAPGFSINTAAGNAFLLTSTGGLTFTDNNASAITGAADGIAATNNTSGALSITTTGTVTAGDVGIAAGGDGDVTISAVNVNGANFGIYAGTNGATGLLSITSTGTVTGTSATGIKALAHGNGLAINAANVSGLYGIVAHNYGAGALTITATGAVTGTGGQGILAIADASTTSTTITTANVTGASSGITALHNGTGALTITTIGTVTGSGIGNAGIIAATGASSTNLTINAVNASGGQNGIYANQQGTGALTITTTGTITGTNTTNSSGIAATGRSTATDVIVRAVDVSGFLYGVRAYNSGTGILSVTTTGTVTSGNVGINALDGGLTTGLSITAADVSGDFRGIFAVHQGSGALTITATGIVTGTTGSGIQSRATYNTSGLVIQAATVTGGQYGIYAANGGTGATSITTTGTVTGTGSGSRGIYTYAGTRTTGLTINAAGVSGDYRGIEARNFGTGALSITTSGAVTATTDDGIFAYGSSYTSGLNIHAANVTGHRGIYARQLGAGALSVTSTGAVTGTGAQGIYAKGGPSSTSLTITTADVTGASEGINANHNGSGPLSITANGTVIGNGGRGIVANLGFGGSDLTIHAASVSGSTDGIFAFSNGSGALSITSTGNVSASNGPGIYARTFSASSVSVTALNASGQYGVWLDHEGSGDATITTTGTVTGTSQQGIYAYTGSNTRNLTITTAGTVTGNQDGIYAKHYGTGALSITSTGIVTGTNSRGIYAYSGSTITDTIITAANVNGHDAGIYAGHSGSGNLSITVTGAVAANAGPGIEAHDNSTAPTSISTVTVTSSGSVNGTVEGLYLGSSTGRAGNVLNAGSITGTKGIVAVGGAVTITNSGAVTGSGGTAIDLTATTGANTVNQQGGTISGNILLSAAADQVHVTGGAINGNVVGQGNAGVDFAIGSGGFTFGSAYTMSGFSTATMISGTAQIAGTINTNSAIVNGGTLIVTGAVNTPSFALNSGGVLSISSDSNLGSGAGALNFNGGILQVTGTGITAPPRSYTWGPNGGGFDIVAANNVFTVGTIPGGGGPLTKLGAGTLVLTGANSYTGGTTVQAGTLQLGDGTTSGSVLGNVTNNGALVFNNPTTQTFAGVISGTGSLTQLGSGSTILTGNNSYTGPTTIAAGTLQLGNGGTSGSLAATAVTDNGALVFNRSDASSFAGTISGTGTVSQIGTGTTTLSGSNSFTGGTTISAGTLVGMAASFGTGAIQDNAALVVDQPVAGTFANAINGMGSFTKQGAGRLNYTGTATLTGPTRVAAGLLSVNGSLSASAVTVQSGGILGGNGTVGATTVQSGGAIAPGNSIGTLHINGAFVQNTGSIYQVEVDPNSNASDLIQVNGAATLQSGAGLNVIKYVPGNYQLGTVYKVLTAGGGLTGNYVVSGQTTNVSGFLGLKDSYDTNNAYLTVVETVPLTSVATTPNQQAVADAVESLPPVANPATGASIANPVQTAVLNLPDAPAAQSALDQLAGVTQAAAKGALLSNSLYVRDVSFDRLRDVICTADESRSGHRPDCMSDGPSVWAQGFGGWGGIAGNANAAGVNHSGAGMLVGVDVPVFDWRLGVFGGFSHADFHLVGANADGGSNDYHLGLYGGTRWDAFALRLGASYSWDGITTNRAVAFGTFTDQLRASYNAGTTQAFAEVGYRMDDDLWGVALEPFANLAYVNLGTSGFTEAGGPAALTVKGDRLENGVATLGVRPSTTVALDGFDVTLRGMMGWRHIFGTIDPGSTVSFAAGGNAFAITGAPNARDVAALEAGLDVGLFDNVRAGLTYGGQFSNRSTEQQARGTIRINF